MIKLIHRYKSSIGIVFLFIAFCFAISGVAVDVISGQRAKGKYAVKVNDREFSLREFQRAEQRVEAQYQQMFGENYAKIAQSIRFNIPQQALDNLIDSSLIEEQAAQVGFAATDAESNEYIVNELFSAAAGGPGFSVDAYRGLLQRAGMSASQFEETVRTDLVRGALVGFLEDMSVVTDHDIKALLRKQETEFTFSAASISASKLAATVPMPTDEEQQKYYERNATDYDLPARVSYDYVTFDAGRFEGDVAVLPQDVEMYYTDNSAKFATPEQIQVRGIKLLYPKEADPKKMAAVKERAQKAYEEATAMKPFESLVTIYSDDLPSKAAGGLKGWMSKSSAPKEYLSSGLFDLEVGGIAKLVEASYGFEILRVEAKKPAGERPLEEVRTEIEKAIRVQEAPAYAAAKAKEIADAVRKGGSLEELTKAAGLTISSTAGQLGEASDPVPSLQGLTSKVLQIPVSERPLPAVIDIGQTTVLVRGKEFLDPAPAPFSEVKQKVVEALKATAAKTLAEAKAKEFLEALKAAPSTDLRALATAKGFEVQGPYTFTRGEPAVAGFKEFSSEMKDSLLAGDAKEILTRYFTSGDAFLMIARESVKIPAESTAGEKFKKYESQALQSAGRKLAEEVVVLLKAKATTIDFDPALLGSASRPM